MDDLGTSAEHVGASYLWRARKRGQRAHILNPETGQAYCQAENCSGGKAFDSRGPGIPDGRRLCQNCADLAERNEASYAEPDVRVLLGERLAEEGDDKWGVNASFRGASTVAPKPWKRGKQARPVNRSKGRKPKRSNVKHPRPFDDPLPW